MYWFLPICYIFAYIVLIGVTAHLLRAVDDKDRPGPSGYFTEFEIRLWAALWPVTWAFMLVAIFTLGIAYVLRQKGFIGGKK